MVQIQKKFAWLENDTDGKAQHGLTNLADYLTQTQYTYKLNYAGIAAALADAPDAVVDFSKLTNGEQDPTRFAWKKEVAKLYETNAWHQLPQHLQDNFKRMIDAEGALYYDNPANVLGKVIETKNILNQAGVKVNNVLALTVSIQDAIFDSLSQGNLESCTPNEVIEEVTS